MLDPEPFADVCQWCAVTREVAGPARGAGRGGGKGKSPGHGC